MPRGQLLPGPPGGEGRDIVAITRRRLLEWGAGLTAAGSCGGFRDDTTGRAETGRAWPAGTGRKVPAVLAGRAAAEWTALGADLSGSLIRPGDADYAAACQLYNTRFDGLRPVAIAYVSGMNDIVTCLAFARRYAVPVAIRSGGHSYAGWSSGNGRLVLDVSLLNTVRILSPDTAVTGAGTRLIDLYTTLAGQGVTVPAGTCPTTGISGLALGGGHGILSRLYGLTCDNLTGATLVTADGTALHCDRDHSPDLFWALRGAGHGNFGVVTHLRFRTHPIGDMATCLLSWPWSAASAVLRAWQGWGPALPDHIWSSCSLANTTGNTPHISVASFAIGAPTTLENALDRLTDTVGSPPAAFQLRRLAFLDTIREHAHCPHHTTPQCHLPGHAPGREPVGKLTRDTFAARSDFFDRSLNTEGIHRLIAGLASFGRRGGCEGHAYVHLTALGGAINRVPPLATAFVHRNSRFLAQYLTTWKAGHPAAAHTAWLDRIHATMQRHASGSAYQNYTDLAVADWRTAYYGNATNRLTQIKHRYDPDHVFTYPQGL
ncbi:FAD-binding oxidoreductase [Streptomyces klenkii]|uniref:FAD-binding oxidoreductase n=1 Tax=Streptomyces klenkii TaxID=1420899 RepID=A0A3B0AG24_9ACTN|nr:FAD-binding oxidoreductase [Streptomyces klenkii]RKN59430.1 FAD-binding oxidoreductase [Streptomyces klenkii]